MALFTPRNEVLLVKQNDVSPHESPSQTFRSEINLESAKLTEDQRDQLKALLSEFNDIFSFPEGPLGRTNVVKNSNQTIFLASS